MNLHEEQEKVQKAMNSALSGLQEDPVDHTRYDTSGQTVRVSPLLQSAEDTCGRPHMKLNQEVSF